MALLTVTTAIALAGCSRGAGNNSANAVAPAANETVANDAEAPAEPPAANETAATESGPIDAAFVTGRWGADGNCAQTIEFHADGTLTPSQGGRWTLAGNVITILMPGAAPDPGVATRTGDDSMSVRGGERTINFTRCPAAAE
jgi:hypothetical protein